MNFGTAYFGAWPDDDYIDAKTHFEVLFFVFHLYCILERLLIGWTFAEEAFFMCCIRMS